MLYTGARLYDRAHWGDSLTVGTGTSSVLTTYPYVVANSGARGRYFYPGGIGGQTSTQIGVRQGGVAVTATISGGQIPTSGGVTVTFPAGFEPITAGGPADGLNGSIAGVPGLLTLASTVYTFRRQNAGALVNVASAQWIPDVSFLANATQIIWAGRNNYSSPSTVQSDIAGMVASITHTRYLVLSILNGNGATERLGSPEYDQIIGINNVLASTYVSRYLDVRATLVAQGAPGGAYPDATAYGFDQPPTGLTSSSPHLNDAGYAIVGQQVYNKLTANGW